MTCYYLDILDFNWLFAPCRTHAKDHGYVTVRALDSHSKVVQMIWFAMYESCRLFIHDNLLGPLGLHLLLVWNDLGRSQPFGQGEILGHV